MTTKLTPALKASLFVFNLLATIALPIILTIRFGTAFVIVAAVILLIVAIAKLWKSAYDEYNLQETMTKNPQYQNKSRLSKIEQD